jgi:hypothetical protein
MIFLFEAKGLKGQKVTVEKREKKYL